MLRSSHLHRVGLLAAVAVVWQCTAVATALGRETLSPAEAARAGLVSAWQRQMTIAGGLAGLADAQVYVDATRPREIVEVTANDQVLLRIPADRVDRSGQPIGIEEAERLARLEIYKLKRRGTEATQARSQVPQVRLYVLGKDGTVEARDGESGRVLWTEQHGDPRLPSLPMAINENFVIFANGMDLIVLDALSGRSVYTRRFRYMPVAGPVIVGSHVMTLCASGRVEGLPLGNFNADFFTAVAAGEPTTGAVAAPDLPRMMWPTEAGYVYAVEGGERPGMAFRFPADGSVTAKPAVGLGGRFFMATDHGQVYGVSALNAGSVLWRYSVGDPIHAPTALFGNRLFVKTIYDDLFCLDATSGRSLWPAPVREVDQILGGTDKQLIIRSTTARLKTLDMETGSAMAEFPATSVVDAIPNPLTDRLYLLTSSGGIQCLRPLAAELPTMLLQEFKPQTAGEAPQKPGKKPAEGATPNATDPFAPAGDDPQTPDGGADPFGGGNDPFGGGADPFGGEDMDDVFGGGADPFAN
ncbi:outer membrane protein assembly factor BamB family protein [Candidatus Laterigemmans baculatus]|uniref:outer membrane protein assembly factor BamB family protein n=1 Tax=Candidatus Laterigemmans baculatus TaxID=2770505 RepID=UPI0013DB0377|nr:PQQ-binding-like beta-propeller repeat protein [Candidatus Laterigemmans baculatus]